MALKGWPDYTRVTGLVDNYDEYGQNYPIGGGDIAARIGSIKTYDMRGRVWWLDNFEAGVLKWDKFSIGIGGSQVLDTLQTRNGNQSCRLTTNTGAGRHSQIRRVFPRPRYATMGCELALSMEQDFGELQATFEIYDGINRNRTAIRFLEATKTIYYWNDLGGWTDTGFEWCAIEDTGMFNMLKIVMDYTTDEYIRIMYDYQELNLTGNLTQVTLSGASPRTLVYIDAIGDGVNNIDCYVDDCILTIMEPR